MQIVHIHTHTSFCVYWTPTEWGPHHFLLIFTEFLWIWSWKLEKNFFYISNGGTMEKKKIGTLLLGRNSQIWMCRKISKNPGNLTIAEFAIWQLTLWTTPCWKKIGIWRRTMLDSKNIWSYQHQRPDNTGICLKIYPVQSRWQRNRKLKDHTEKSWN